MLPEKKASEQHAELVFLLQSFSIVCMLDRRSCWELITSVTLIRTESVLYKAVVCLLKDITSLSLAVLLTEPWALGLSRRQTKGGECTDSSGKGGQTQQQLHHAAAEKKFSSTFCDPYMKTTDIYCVWMHPHLKR